MQVLLIALSTVAILSYLWVGLLIGAELIWKEIAKLYKKEYEVNPLLAVPLTAGYILINITWPISLPIVLLFIAFQVRAGQKKTADRR